jgi:hypothetical protein
MMQLLIVFPLENRIVSGIIKNYSMRNIFGPKKGYIRIFPDIELYFIRNLQGGYCSS